MRKFQILVVFFYSMTLSLFVSGQNVEAPADSSHSIFELLTHEHDSIAEVKLETDWAGLIQQKMKEEYQEGVLSFQQTDGSMLKLNVKLRARGNVRKQVCLYPPIKIKIPKNQLTHLGLRDTFNDLKLILSCREGKQYEDCLLKEALAYKLYELISPVYFKTKVIKMAGWDGDKERFAFYAMLIEDDLEFSSRLHAKKINTETVKTHTLDRETYLKMTFFQYMIANVDWAIHNKHNVSMFFIPGFQKPVSVAYDFDYSGFVSTNYAVPHESVPITSVTQRYFMGQFVTLEEAMKTAAFFQSKKEDILRTCASYYLLDDKNRQSLERYLLKFFEVLDKKKKIKREFVSKR
ncbi:MAG: hypothetical protein JNK77_19835 [Saprospiraceae bacterium]|nr:hypothetical protein [Saprospiraceae bacterium]